MASPSAILRNASELDWTLLEEGNPAGGKRAELFGDHRGSGVYTFRLHLAAGPDQGRPHWHPDYEFGTVVSGSFWVAAGSRLDRSSAKELTSGAFDVIPPQVRHAIWTDDEVTLQIHGPGPRATYFEEIDGGHPSRSP